MFDSWFKEKLGFPCSVHHRSDVYCFKVATFVAVLELKNLSSNPLRFFSLFGLRQIVFRIPFRSQASLQLKNPQSWFFLMILKIFQGYFTVQLSMFFVVVSCDSSVIITCCLSFVNNFFNFIFKSFSTSFLLTYCFQHFFAVPCRQLDYNNIM